MGALRLVTARVARSRYGVALLVAAVVLAIVGGTRLIAGPGTVGSGLPGGGLGAVASSAAADDGESASLPTPSLATAPGAAAPDAVAVAFATAWLNHHGVDSGRWLAGMRPYATRALVTTLTGADPAGVPAERITGQVRLVPRGESFAEAAIPVDSGTLRLRLVASGGHWLVDGVDWERA